MNRPKVAYQGQPGAFSHEACLTFLPDHDPVAVPSFAAVIEAVSRGETDLGILPVENNAAGPVEEALSLLSGSGLATVAEHPLPVRMHLLALPGAPLRGIKTVISHPVALAQCRETLRTLGLPSEGATNTAVAAKMIASGTDTHTGVLASEAAADAYGLKILRRDMHDRPDNTTTFRVLARQDDPA